MSVVRTVIKFTQYTYHDYKKGKLKDSIIREGTFIIITDIPWWRRFFGIMSSRRIIIGDGITPLRKLKFS